MTVGDTHDARSDGDGDLPARTGLVYLASPYKSESYGVMVRRERRAAEASARLIDMGFHVYSPIVHSAPVARSAYEHGLSLRDDEFDWVRYDFVMLERCDVLWILRLEGWYRSKGIRRESARAAALGLPVASVPTSLLPQARFQAEE